MTAPREHGCRPDVLHGGFAPCCAACHAADVEEINAHRQPCAECGGDIPVCERCVSRRLTAARKLAEVMANATTALTILRIGAQGHDQIGIDNMISDLNDALAAFRKVDGGDDE